MKNGVYLQHMIFHLVKLSFLLYLSIPIFLLKLKTNQINFMPVEEYTILDKQSNYERKKNVSIFVNKSNQLNFHLK